MSSQLTPYFAFNGTARAAMEFYQSVLGGELTVNTFGEFGSTGAEAEGVMHSQLESEAGYLLMASDLPPGETETPGTTNVSAALFGDDGEKMRAYYAGLSEGGQIQVPLEKQMWGDEYGQFIDKFGITWMFNISEPAAS